MKHIIYLACCLIFQYCSAQNNIEQSVIVLGNAQDGGYPHLGCEKKCCKQSWANPNMKKYVTSLALVNPSTNQWWLFEATPDIKEQLHYFQTLTQGKYKYLPDGIFITHAHIGHYTGLMQLGREVMSTKNIPVYVLPKMHTYLGTNGPWSQLVSLHNIALQPLQNDATVIPANGISIVPFTVPHRDEYSETAGFKIITSSKSYLFIPDIDKWEKWNKGIIEEIKSVDIALIDATFYDSTELPGRNMKEVPHPLVIETIKLFESSDKKLKQRIHFIHLNHTNPLLWNKAAQKRLNENNYNIAIQGQSY